MVVAWTKTTQMLLVPFLFLLPSKEKRWELKTTTRRFSCLLSLLFLDQWQQQLWMIPAGRPRPSKQANEQTKLRQQQQQQQQGWWARGERGGS
jgi:hypothetical protein